MHPAPLAPPHTRGSTRRRGPDRRRPHGSPALAGIDPCAPSTSRFCARLPRTRGDRPLLERLKVACESAPPHTRGSTPALGRRRGRLGGSPAHAGIDPKGYRARAVPVGLPRTRGDRPQADLSLFYVGEAPPHTRGSTRGHERRREPRVGSPAPAGVAPSRRVGWGSRSGLPRTRGDRPHHPTVKPVALMAPPHTRGSTRPVTPPLPPPHGSPAHAGIDPWSRRARSRSRWLPRTRGDRPITRVAFASPPGAPPHTRGSTLRKIDDAARAEGSPAHAGIDPSTTPCPRQVCRLPRTRGDRPTVMRCVRVTSTAPPHTRGSTPRVDDPARDAEGSPAHAGIDPTRDAARPIGGRLPRTRGDRPSVSSVNTANGMAPPHTRGSTLTSGTPRPHDDGSPAHAGIDPRSARGASANRRLPRTRGDRPSAPSP